MFGGGFLFFIAHGLDYDVGSAIGSEVASRVISRELARLLEKISFNDLL